MNRFLVITIVVMLLILTGEGIYYLKFIRPKNNTKTTEIIAVTSYPTPTASIKKKQLAEEIEFISGTTFNYITNNNKPVSHRVGSIVGKIIKVEPEGITVNTESGEKLYLFNSRVYLYLRHHPTTNIGFTDIKSGQQVEFTLILDSKKIDFLIIED